MKIFLLIVHDGIKQWLEIISFIILMTMISCISTKTTTSKVDLQPPMNETMALKVVPQKTLPSDRRFIRTNCWESSGMADFDQNGVQDILWRNKIDGTVEIDYLDWDNQQQTFFPMAKSGKIYQEVRLAYKIAAIGDVNGDKYPDIIWQLYDYGSNKVYIQTGPFIKGVNASGSFLTDNNSTAKSFFSDLANYIVGTGDFNQDKKDELLVRNTRTGELIISTLIFNNNRFDIEVNQSIYHEVDGSWRIIAIEDYNNDNKKDILWRNDYTGNYWIQYISNNKITGQKSIYYEPDLYWESKTFGTSQIIFHNNRSHQIVEVNTSNGQRRLITETSKDDELLGKVITKDKIENYSILIRNKKSGAIHTHWVQTNNVLPYDVRSPWNLRPSRNSLQKIWNNVNSTKIQQYYKALENCGPRTVAINPNLGQKCRYDQTETNSGFHQAAAYLKNQLLSFGYQQNQIYLQDIDANYGFNTILTINGKYDNTQVIELTAHLDSVDIGGNDNATGSAAVLEIARILKNYRNNYTLRLVWFAAEEISVPAPGSNKYLQAFYAKSCRQRLIANLNIDSIGSRKKNSNGTSTARIWYRGLEGMSLSGVINNLINDNLEFKNILSPVRQITKNYNDIDQCIDFTEDNNTKFCRYDLDPNSILTHKMGKYSKNGNWKNICSSNKSDFLVEGQGEEETYFHNGFLNSISSIGGFCYSKLGFKFPIHSAADRSTYFDEDLDYIIAITKLNTAILLHLDNL